MADVIQPVGQLLAFISTIPERISIAAMMRVAFTGSPSAVMPTRNAPTAPMPVQTVYAVPSGSVRIEYESKAKLAIIAVSVMMDAAGRVKP